MGQYFLLSTPSSAEIKSSVLFGYKFRRALGSGQALKTDTWNFPDLSFGFANFAGGQIIASATAAASEDEGRREVFLLQSLDSKPMSVGQLPLATYAMSTMKMTEFRFAIAGGLNGMIRYVCLSNHRLNPSEE